MIFIHYFIELNQVNWLHPLRFVSYCTTKFFLKSQMVLGNHVLSVFHIWCFVTVHTAIELIFELLRCWWLDTNLPHSALSVTGATMTAFALCGSEVTSVDTLHTMVLNYQEDELLGNIITSTLWSPWHTFEFPDCSWTLLATCVAVDTLGAPMLPPMSNLFVQRDNKQGFTALCIIPFIQFLNF